MHKSELLSILNELDMHPSKKLGQNFLVDDNCLAALVRAAAPSAGENILEIGPGTGVLTSRILAAGCNLTAIEFDSRLEGFIRGRYGKQPNMRLIHADACKVDYEELFPAGVNWRCIANLPYSCASLLLARLSGMSNPPSSFHVLLQREMAERLAAKVGTKDYGVLTVRLAFDYEARIVRIVPAGVFFPPPEVASAFLELKRRDEVPPRELVRRAGDIAGAAFAQRRKKACKLLEKAFPGIDFAAAFQNLGIPADARAEVISPEQYIELAKI